MKMNPVIGLIGRCEKIENYDTWTLHKEYSDAILKEKGNPILYLPNNWNKQEEKRFLTFLKQCNGIMLPGGSEVLKHDLFAIRYALKQKIPLFGICLGMQAMAIYQKKDGLKRITKDNHCRNDKTKVHDIIIDPKSKLFKLVNKKTKLTVNSRHHYQVRNSGIFKECARSKDGIIEAIENENHPFQIGVQWHPESMIDLDCNERKLIKEFIKHCKKKKVNQK